MIVFLRFSLGVLGDQKRKTREFLEAIFQRIFDGRSTAIASDRPDPVAFMGSARLSVIRPCSTAG